MAITGDVLLAVAIHPPAAATASSKDAKIQLSNVRDKYPAREFAVPATGDIEIDARELEWSNYFKAGLRGAIQLLRKKYGDNGFVPSGMDVLVDGRVPTGAGLSSSAAFVSASALAVMIANGEKGVDKSELVELAIVSERAVGVNSGG
jgi:galactokinase